MKYSKPPLWILLLCLALVITFLILEMLFDIDPKWLMIISAIIGIIFVLANYRKMISKAPLWLLLIWLASVITFFILGLMLEIIPKWLMVVSAISGAVTGLINYRINEKEQQKAVEVK